MLPVPCVRRNVQVALRMPSLMYKIWYSIQLQLSDAFLVTHQRWWFVDETDKLPTSGAELIAATARGRARYLAQNSKVAEREGLLAFMLCDWKVLDSNIITEDEF